MYRSLLSVGGFTLISRITGFMRDMIMAYVMAPGPLSDAFFVAFRLPNHFRTIFAEGAYNAAFIPLYSSLRTEGEANAQAFARTMMGWQLAIQLILLVLALVGMPWVVAILAPGFVDDPAQMASATELTRITFGCLLCVALVTHLGGVLNAEKKFWAAAAAPVLLNITMSIALGVAWLFPSAAHAASWGVLAGGIVQLMLLANASWAVGLPVLPSWPSLSKDVVEFFKRFGPATIGAAGVQIAMFADTIFASFLGSGAYTSLYYADRVNQLPMGVIAIALGTVLLPELSKSIGVGDQQRATRSFNRATEIGLLLTLPCTAAFLVIPDAIMHGLFARGAFNAEAANAAGAVLLAYASGLPAFVMLRTVTPLFHARGDTRTPVVATGLSILVNLALKVLFVMHLAMGVEGLALATALGTWVNLLILGVLASLRGYISLDDGLKARVARMVGAAVYAGLVAWLVQEPLTLTLQDQAVLKAETIMIVLSLTGLCGYGVALLGSGWRPQGGFRLR
jgi:putative peptidoglycan lipid II flippase